MSMNTVRMFGGCSRAQFLRQGVYKVIWNAVEVHDGPDEGDEYTISSCQQYLTEAMLMSLTCVK